MLAAVEGYFSSGEGSAADVWHGNLRGALRARTSPHFCAEAAALTSKEFM